MKHSNNQDTIGKEYIMDFGMLLFGAISIGFRSAEIHNILSSYGGHVFPAYILTRYFGKKGLLTANIVNVAFEIAQSNHYIGGVGDYKDVVGGIAGTAAAIIVTERAKKQKTDSEHKP